MTRRPALEYERATQPPVQTFGIFTNAVICTALTTPIVVIAAAICGGAVGGVNGVILFGVLIAAAGVSGILSTRNVHDWRRSVAARNGVLTGMLVGAIVIAVCWVLAWRSLR